MKKLFLILLTIILVLPFCSCSNVITEGEVYKKEYREEYTTIIMLPFTISNGKTVTTTIIPYFVHYPDRYAVFIKAYQGEEWKTEDFYVSKEVYDSISIGDMFLYDEERGDLQDEPYTKERKEE